MWQRVFYYWCCRMPRRSDINERRCLSSPEETSTFTGAILVQRRALEWRRGPHITFLDKVSPISTQFPKVELLWCRIYHPERTVRLRLFVLTHVGAHWYQWGHRHASQDMSGGNLGTNILVLLVLFENNSSQNKGTGPFSGIFLPCNLLCPLGRALDKSRSLEGRVFVLLNLRHGPYRTLSRM
jgi:hypothetical protein